MSVKHYLEELKNMDATINRKLEELERLKCLSQKVTAVYTDMPRGGSTSKSRVEDMVVRIVDLSEEINIDIDRYFDLKSEASKMIEGIENPEYRNILSLRYVCGKTFESIAVELNYSYQWICTLHGRSIVAFEERYNERYAPEKLSAC